MRARSGLLVFCVAALVALGAHAQVAASWPTKPVRWIVPFPPGGSADVISRVVAQKLAERIGQPVVVENRSGASGNVGHEAVAKAAPDGYTVLFVVPGIVTNPFSVGQVKSGRVRAIASTSTKRGSGPFPDLALASETVPDFELITWHGVMVPRATPRDIVLRLNRELDAVLDQPDVRQRFVEGGFDIAGGTAEAFGELLRREYAKYERILREAGVRPE